MYKVCVMSSLVMYPFPDLAIYFEFTSKTFLKNISKVLFTQRYNDIFV